MSTVTKPASVTIKQCSVVQRRLFRRSLYYCLIIVRYNYTTENKNKLCIRWRRLWHDNRRRRQHHRRRRLRIHCSTTAINHSHRHIITCLESSICLCRNGDSM